jgi:hypothetical protein
MISRRTVVCLSLGLSALVAAALWWVYPEYVERTLGLVLVDISGYPYIRIHPLFRIMVVTSLVMILIAIVLGFVDRAHARKLQHKNHG